MKHKIEITLEYDDELTLEEKKGLGIVMGSAGQGYLSAIRGGIPIKFIAYPNEPDEGSHL